MRTHRMAAAETVPSRIAAFGRDSARLIPVYAALWALMMAPAMVIILAVAPGLAVYGVIAWAVTAVGSGVGIATQNRTVTEDIPAMYPPDTSLRFVAEAVLGAYAPLAAGLSVGLLVDVAAAWAVLQVAPEYALAAPVAAQYLRLELRQFGEGWLDPSWGVTVLTRRVEQRLGLLPDWASAIITTLGKAT